jgi:2-haloalkanoic acid dehalogenase type II
VKRDIFLFFDLGGTLVDLRGIVTSMAKQLQASRLRGPVPIAIEWAIGTARLLPSSQGPKFRPEREIASDVLCALLEKRGRRDAREESVRLVTEAWNGFVNISSLHPDASEEWLRGLRAQVAGIGLVTDGDTEAVDAVLSHLRITEWFDSVTASEAVRAYKPDARIYRAALKALGARPADSLFVSDAALDLQGAATLGMSGVWIPRGFLPEGTEIPPRTPTMSSLRELTEIVRRFKRAGRSSSC